MIRYAKYTSSLCNHRIRTVTPLTRCCMQKPASMLFQLNTRIYGCLSVRSTAEICRVGRRKPSLCVIYASGLRKLHLWRGCAVSQDLGSRPHRTRPGRDVHSRAKIPALEGYKRKCATISKKVAGGGRVTTGIQRFEQPRGNLPATRRISDSAFLGVGRVVGGWFLARVY